MSEYIITDKQLKTATEAYLEHELSRPITGVFVSDDKLPEIVRCMDCVWFANDSMHGAWCKNFGASLHDDYDGFCAWGERRDANGIEWRRTDRTCKVESCCAFSYDFSPEVYYEFKMQCGGSFDWSVEEPPSYCPNCGARIMGK